MTHSLSKIFFFLQTFVPTSLDVNLSFFLETGSLMYIPMSIFLFFLTFFLFLHGPMTYLPKGQDLLARYNSSYNIKFWEAIYFSLSTSFSNLYQLSYPNQPKRKFVRLFGFYGISTCVGYLMPNPFYTNKQLYFKEFSFHKNAV